MALLFLVGQTNKPYLDEGRWDTLFQHINSVIFQDELGIPKRLEIESLRFRLPSVLQTLVAAHQ